ncbi:MAG: endonuclease/exonuclease/phosphatase family protein [Bacteroidota bacterium]
MAAVASPPSHSRRWLRPFVWLAVVAETAVLAVALVGALAAYLPPHAFWWAQLVALGLPYWTALLALATLSLVLRKQRGWALSYAVLLAWVLVRTVPLGWAGTAPEASPDDLVLLTFNTPASGASREVLADGVYAFFEQTVPTVASLQEAITITSETQRWQPNHLDLVTDSLRYRVPMPPFEANGMAQTAVPLYVRPDQAAPDGFVVLEQRGHTLMPDEDYPSEVLRTHFRWRGREGVHYNLHLASFGMDKPWNDGVPFYSLSGGLGYLRQYRDAVRRRGRHVEAIRALVDAETLPVLISGDFNTTPYTWSFRQLRQSRTDAFRTRGRGWGGTYRADLPFVRIDFVLADPAWEIVRAEVPSLFLSDHKPLLVRLRWADAEEGTEEPAE